MAQGVGEEGLPDPHGTHDADVVPGFDEAQLGELGELALLDREQRSASVVAETQCELLFIDPCSLVAFGNHYTETGLAVTAAGRPARPGGA